MKISVIMLYVLMHLFSCSNSMTITKTPVIYLTDLFHPHGDPDDNYDIASVFAIPTIEIKGIVLDGGAQQSLSPGDVSVDQINYLSGRNIPYAIGLSDKLTSTTDTGTSQSSVYQGGVDLILNQLSASAARVNLVSVGSLRDIAAAYNRNKQLFEAKVDKIMVFAGEATANYEEANVVTDPNAYLAIMRSGLNIYWVPCFDGGLYRNDNGHASFFQVPHQGVLLDGINDKLLQYFIYSLNNRTDDPIEYLHQAVNQADKEALFAEVRNIWASNIFEALTGTYDHSLFYFTPVNVSFDANGIAIYNQSDSKTMMRFQVTNLATYTNDMSTAINKLLRSFPMTATRANYLSPKAYIDNMFNGIIGQAIYPLHNQ